MSYKTALIAPAEEHRLLESIGGLPFREAQYKEWNARRRIVSYGGRYDFDSNTLRDAEPLPSFLYPLRERIAAFADIPAADFTHALINEYAPGTPLGWHRDAPVYGTVAGVSLAGMGRMRLRPYPPRAGTSARAALVLDLAPRSAYILQGPARWDWQHAISPTKALRYSITFRTLVPHA
jgi:alkylated DNA repair dioxygenase AlkB